MMNERIKVNGTIGSAIDDLSSQRSKGFFDGARAMMTALETMSSEERSWALARKNQQHIIALLLESEKRQQARRHQEACLLLDYYSINKEQMRAFIFDVPAIDDLTGKAMDGEGNFIEDEKFELLSGKTNPGYPNAIIYNYDTDQKISQSEYNALSAEEKEEKYGRYRILTITSPSGKPALEIRSFNHELMAELIRRDIMIGDTEVNKRYLKMNARVYFKDEASNVPREFCNYEQVIASALKECECLYGKPEGVLHDYHQDIVGAMLEAKIKERKESGSPSGQKRGRRRRK